MASIVTVRDPLGTIQMRDRVELEQPDPSLVQTDNRQRRMPAPAQEQGAAGLGGVPLVDARLNPVFNAIRDRLLTPQELEHARELAYRAGDPGFQGW